MRHVATVVLALMALACTGSKVVPLPEDPAEALAWLPADVSGVQHQGRGHVAILEYVKSTLGDRRPDCLDRVTAGVDHAFMLWRFLGDPDGVNAVHGLRDRDASERCLAEVWKALAPGQAPRLERDGAFTRLGGAGGTVTLLAWSKDGWLYFGEARDRLEAMLRRGGAPTLAAPLRPLLARVSMRDAMWSVHAGDVLGFFTGVTSTGVVQRTIRIPAGEPLRSLPVVFTFPADDDAERAREAMSAASRDEALPEPLRRALSTLAPRVAGAELEVDVWPVLRDGEVVVAGVEWVKRAAACRDGDDSACAGRAPEGR